MNLFMHEFIFLIFLYETINIFFIASKTKFNFTIQDILHAHSLAFSVSIILPPPTPLPSSSALSNKVRACASDVVRQSFPDFNVVRGSLVYMNAHI